MSPDLGPMESGLFSLSQNWGLNSGLGTCKAGALLLEPHLQSPVHFALVILEMGWPQELFDRLALNHEPPDPSLPCS
jgi:hypothetical protein